jgi:hypothetical protein
MKISLAKFLVASILVAGFAFQASAQTTPAPAAGIKNHPCMAEHQAVVAQCEKGDPCGAACKQAHKAMRQCRMANNLPTHKLSGSTKPKASPCKSTSAAPTGSMSAPVATPPAH